MADYHVDGKVGVVTINNPPVNALNQKTRAAILENLIKAQNDVNAQAIVICGKGRTFPVGADLSEFGSGAVKGGISILNISNNFESSRKPVIAAIHGNALGGGLELALGCHYRVASVTAKLGLPEVKVGLLPGAGGTQRLPRVIGLDNALDWITSGRHNSANDAAKLGLVDRVVPKGASVIDTAIDFAHTVIGKGLADRRTSLRSVVDGNKVNELVAKHNTILMKKSRGAMAPFLCMQAVKNSAICSYEEGIKRERVLMETLITSNQSSAQIYAFFAQREIQKWKQPNTNVSYQTAKPMKIKKAGVIGLGTMGRGIVILFLQAGIPVIALETNEKFLKSGMDEVHKIIDDSLKRNLINAQQCGIMKSNVKGTTLYNDLNDVDFVIEAVFENMKVKKEVFSKLDKACKSSAILASNTSGLDIDEIASATKRPNKVMGTHFFAPAHKMKLLENIFGEKSSPETIATGMYLGKLMKKVTVLVGNCPGFVGNRMFFTYNTEGDFMLEEGAYPIDVDNATLGFGFPMGKYAINDLSGNDIGLNTRKSRGLLQSQQEKGTSERFRQGMRYCPIADELCYKNRLGLKRGKGWHDYLPSNPSTPVPSQEVQSMIDTYRAKHNIKARRIDSEEILERLLFPMINVGFQILEEGFAASPLDIDMVYLYGYGWPAHTGGPMFYAHTIGLPKFLKKLEYYNEKYGEVTYHWSPNKMLKWLVENHGNPSIHTWMKLWNERVNIPSKL